MFRGARMNFKHSNCIVIFNRDKSKVLFCKRVKEPFKGQYNFVGGKAEPNESSVNVALEFTEPKSNLEHDGKYIGLDGCKGGWIATVLDKENLRIEKYSDIQELVNANGDYDELLVDMVIGLPSSLDELRPDAAARALIPGRTSTIFAVPSRQSVYADTREKIREANKNALGKDLPLQAIAIIPKMREIDEFLQSNKAHKNRLKESHPEVCFSRLNGAVVMSRKVRKGD